MVWRLLCAERGTGWSVVRCGANPKLDNTVTRVTTVARRARIGPVPLKSGLNGAIVTFTRWGGAGAAWEASRGQDTPFVSRQNFGRWAPVLRKMGGAKGVEDGCSPSLQVP